jgi:hypothetical protein
MIADGACKIRAQSGSRAKMGVFCRDKEKRPKWAELERFLTEVCNFADALKGRLSQYFKGFKPVLN